jgi:hypothetical protein
MAPLVVAIHGHAEGRPPRAGLLGAATRSSGAIFGRHGRRPPTDHHPEARVCKGVAITAISSVGLSALQVERERLEEVNWHSRRLRLVGDLIVGQRWRRARRRGCCGPRRPAGNGFWICFFRGLPGSFRSLSRMRSRSGGVAGGALERRSVHWLLVLPEGFSLRGGFDAGARLPRQLAVEQFPRVDRCVLPLRPPRVSLSGKRPSIVVTATLGCGPCGSQGWAARLLHDHRIVAGTRKSTCVGLLQAGRQAGRQAGGARRPPRSPGPAPDRVHQHHLSDHATL